MKRVELTPRENWQEKVESIDFFFHTMDNAIYWDESACYEFTQDQVDELEKATNELHKMCLEAIEFVIREKRYKQFAIPEWMQPIIERSWNRKDLAVYGRFDFSYDGKGLPKMLEYNADTPTSLYEAGVVQKLWQQELYGDKGQFNTLHQKLIDRWKLYKAQAPDELFHFSCITGHEEDLGTTAYMRQCAEIAGLNTQLIYVEQIAWHEEEKVFTDPEGQPINYLFKLYPWEFLVTEPYGKYLPEEAIHMIEPAWKMLLSNKAIMAILWEMFPDHPNLLPTFFEKKDSLGDRYISKPLLSREGANVTLHTPDRDYTVPGDYGKEGCVFQEYYPLPNNDGNFPVIGSWVVGDEAAGMGIREDYSRVTKNTSRFLPHFVVS